MVDLAVRWDIDRTPIHTPREVIAFLRHLTAAWAADTAKVIRS